jgi:tRNA pseudouridine55 synthase
MNGVIVVDKPAGPTSHDVVARVRRTIGVRRICHTGTLDPVATGVLPLVVGRATRLAQFLSADEKEYVADVRFGLATTSYDSEGLIDNERVAGAIPAVEPHVLRELVDDFRGTYWQTPPPFSAKKVGGTRAYRLARAEKPVELKPVKVTVRDLELLSCGDGLAKLRIVCSSGFYVRSLAHEIGTRLECGAYLQALRRTRAGEFTIAEATTLEGIERAGADAIAHLVPMSALLPRMPPVVVNERGARRAVHGNALAPEDLSEPSTPDAERVRVFDADGTLLGIAEAAAGGLLHPVVVLV